MFPAKTPVTVYKGSNIDETRPLAGSLPVLQGVDYMTVYLEPPHFAETGLRVHLNTFNTSALARTFPASSWSPRGRNQLTFFLIGYAPTLVPPMT